VDIGEGITFATVQTLAKIDITKYWDYWDVVIVDECQHCAGTPTRVTQFYKVISGLCARYKIGLTATPFRADGLELSMYALLGGILHEVTREEVAHTTCPIKILQLDTNWYPADDVLGFDGIIDYSKVIDSLTHDEARFYLVAGYVGGLDGPAIVLANRVEYLQRMAALVGTDTEDLYGIPQNDAKRVMCLSGMGQSKKAKAERKEALRKLNEGELDCVFCTYQLASEGLDVPNLKYVVFATPEKDPTRIQQASGRVGRKAPNKDCGIVIDFVDAFGVYKSWKKKRETVYKKLGYDII
jgi:superfamily II DNA or RNA helicase